jgi:diguanylate cyclase (GGDEF)-like protein
MVGLLAVKSHFTLLGQSSIGGQSKMKNFSTKNISPENQHHPRTFSAVWRWLTEPAAAILSEPERRRSNMLTILILTLIFSAGIFLVSLFIFVSIEVNERGLYTILIGVLLCLFTLALGINRTGHYSAAAGLIVGCMVLGPWFSILLNLSFLDSDVFRMGYIAASVLLCSFLLSTRVTFFLALLQLAALLLVSLISPVLTCTTWSSLLGFIGFMSVLSIISNLLDRRDLEQIDRQTRQLTESETSLRELSVRDQLTGLFNRRYLDETLEREVHRAARKQLPLGVIMLDIDHFKHVNDTVGHAAGDELLQVLGKLLYKQVRRADIACRYGGEEFVLIMPEASLDVTKERAEQLLEQVKHLRVEHKNHSLGIITISLGVAAFPNHGSTGEAVLKSADVALYRAKREGRDRVVVADQS